MPRLPFAVAATLVAFNPSFGQDFSMVGSSVAGITMPVVLNPCTGGACGRTARPDRQPGRMAAGRMGGTAPSAHAFYQPSTALAREAQAGYVDRIRHHDPAAAAIVSKQLAQHDYRQIYHGLLAGSGLQDNDAVDVMTAYTVLGWMIAINHQSAIGNDMVAAVRQQVAPRFLNDRRLTAAGTPAKLGEEMKLLYVTLQSGWQSAQREGKLQQYSDGVAAMFRAQSGQDLRRLRLTRNGFEQG